MKQNNVKNWICDKIPGRKNYKIQEMQFRILMDRPANDHYISPSGYTLKTNNKTYHFDFAVTEGYIDPYHKDQICMEVKEYDNEYSEVDVKNFPDALTILTQNAEFTEFNIFTGDDSDPEIHPKKILNLSITFKNPNNRTVRLDAKRELLQKIDEVLTDDY